MRALVSAVVGGPETLAIGELPDPEPGPGEVLVRVRACGVNDPDALTIRDLYQVKYPRPFAPGAEVCGVVERLGEGATGFAAGDLVVGFVAGIPRVPLNLVLLKACRIVGVDVRMFREEAPQRAAANAAALVAMMTAGRLRPSVGGTFPLERAPEAIARLMQRRAIGKLVVSLGAGADLSP